MATQHRSVTLEALLSGRFRGLVPRNTAHNRTSRSTPLFFDSKLFAALGSPSGSVDFSAAMTLLRCEEASYMAIVYVRSMSKYMRAYAPGREIMDYAKDMDMDTAMFETETGQYDAPIASREPLARSGCKVEGGSASMRAWDAAREAIHLAKVATFRLSWYTAYLVRKASGKAVTAVMWRPNIRLPPGYVQDPLTTPNHSNIHQFLTIVAESNQGYASVNPMAFAADDTVRVHSEKDVMDCLCLPEEHSDRWVHAFREMYIAAHPAEDVIARERMDEEHENAVFVVGNTARYAALCMAKGVRLLEHAAVVGRSGGTENTGASLLAGVAAWESPDEFSDSAIKDSAFAFMNRDVAVRIATKYDSSAIAVAHCALSVIGMSKVVLALELGANLVWGERTVAYIKSICHQDAKDKEPRWLARRDVEVERARLHAITPHAKGPLPCIVDRPFDVVVLESQIGYEAVYPPTTPEQIYSMAAGTTTRARPTEWRGELTPRVWRSLLRAAHCMAHAARLQDTLTNTWMAHFARFEVRGTVVRPFSTGPDPPTGFSRPSTATQVTLEAACLAVAKEAKIEYKPNGGLLLDPRSGDASSTYHFEHLAHALPDTDTTADAMRKVVTMRDAPVSSPAVQAFSICAHEANAEARKVAARLKGGYAADQRGTHIPAIQWLVLSMVEREAGDPIKDAIGGVNMETIGTVITALMAMKVCHDLVQNGHESGDGSHHLEAHANAQAMGDVMHELRNPAVTDIATAEGLDKVRTKKDIKNNGVAIQAAFSAINVLKVGYEAMRTATGPHKVADAIYESASFARIGSVHLVPRDYVFMEIPHTEERRTDTGRKRGRREEQQADEAWSAMRITSACMMRMTVKMLCNSLTNLFDPWGVTVSASMKRIKDEDARRTYTEQTGLDEGNITSHDHFTPMRIPGHTDAAEVLVLHNKLLPAVNNVARDFTARVTSLNTMIRRVVEATQRTPLAESTTTRGISAAAHTLHDAARRIGVTGLDTMASGLYRKTRNEHVEPSRADEVAITHSALTIIHATAATMHFQSFAHAYSYTFKFSRHE